VPALVREPSCSAFGYLLLRRLRRSIGISAHRDSGYTQALPWPYGNGPTTAYSMTRVATHRSVKEKIQMETWSGARFGVVLVSHVLSLG
jgi:hypothetical protein